MANNPIFPFYVNDFEGGTRHMTDAEVGCYLRLLMAQFNRGGQLPSDEKLLSRYCTSFNESWPIVSEKFSKINGTKIQNKRLETERIKRENFVESRSKNKKGKTKSHDNHKKDISESSENHLGKGKGYGKGDEKGNGYGNNDGGTGEEKYIVPQMTSLWYQNFPAYTQDKENDSDGMGKILSFISRQHKLLDIQETNTQIKILNTLQLVADQVNKESFWVNKSVKSIANHIQEFYNKIKNPQENGTAKPVTKNNGATAAGVQAILKERIAARQKQ